jgi:hypothetical protein
MSEERAFAPSNVCANCGEVYVDAPDELCAECAAVVVDHIKRICLEQYVETI